MEIIKEVKSVSYGKGKIILSREDMENLGIESEGHVKLIRVKIEEVKQ